MKNRITQTPKFQTRIVGVIAADVPSDGGKWMLVCEHLEDGEWLGCGVIQDDNKKRLAAWTFVKRGEGFTEWCPECQDAHAEMVGAWWQPRKGLVG